MAANIIQIGSARFRASAVSSHRDPDHHHHHNRRERSYRSWWSSLFGYSGEADYVDSDDKEEEEDEKSDEIKGKIDKKTDRSDRFWRGGFTEEKARHLRLLTAGTSSFPEVMYRSAIASRLASDFSKRD